MRGVEVWWCGGGAVAWRCGGVVCMWWCGGVAVHQTLIRVATISQRYTKTMKAGEEARTSAAMAFGFEKNASSIYVENSCRLERSP